MDINVPPKLTERALKVYAKKTGNQIGASGYLPHCV